VSSIENIVEAIRRRPDCRVLPPSGVPALATGYVLPDDVCEFYRRCGGVDLFTGSDYATNVVPPEAFVKANPEIVGCECPDDISDAWYIVVRDVAGERLTIDCDPTRLGRCYDSFWDSHGVAGSCAIVALSFTELLERMLGASGRYAYWLAEGGLDYGDAYDTCRGTSDFEEHAVVAMSEQYTAEGIIKNAWPEWVADASGGWTRTWKVAFEAPPTEAQLGATLDIDELSVVICRDEQLNCVVFRARTTSNPWSDQLFFHAAYELFIALERLFGRIVSIQGQSRNLWRPFRT